MKIFLDDERTPEDCSKYMHHRIGPMNPIYLQEWTVVRTFAEFCRETVNNVGKITHISFDHDLADCFQLREQKDLDEWFDINGKREYTGLDCAKHLDNLYMLAGEKLPIIFVHSANIIGTKRILDLFGMEYYKRFL